MVQVRNDLLGELYDTLVGLGTPSIIANTIKLGFSHWISDSSDRTRAPTYGSLKQADILLTSVYYDQFYQIGW
jgi:hypothetical protein